MISQTASYRSALRRSPRAHKILASATAIATLAIAHSPARAEPPSYNIVTLGLTDPEHTRSDGFQSSGVQCIDAAGHVFGTSNRYGSAGELGINLWFYNGASTVPIGLTDSSHTRADGYQYTYVYSVNGAGQAVGNSFSFYDDGHTGMSTWVFNGGSTARVGLCDAEHTGPNGEQASWPVALTEPGADGMPQALGYSARYSGSQYAGQSSWLYSGGSTKRLGFTDATHTRSDGHQDTMAYWLTPSGLVAGSSARYDATMDGNPGSSAWVYSGGTTTRIGLIDAEHTAANGYQASEVHMVNAAGQIVGGSYQSASAGSNGYSAWIYDRGTTTRLGFIDAEHTAANGSRHTEAQALNEAGQVVGQSYRFSGDDGLGESAWIYSGGVCTRIGLIDAQHTSSTGYQDNYVGMLNASGQVAGGATRYYGSNEAGHTAWIYTGGITVSGGLTDAEHTAADGSRNSTVDFMNDAGQVVGYASRYKGADENGMSVWMFSGGTTRRLGLHDARHTDSIGAQYSWVDHLNAIGQATGTSARFDGAALLGESGWFYDDDSDITTPLVFSERDDGYAETMFSCLGDDGLVLGSFEKFSGSMDLGTVGFYWTPTEGFHELRSLVAGGISTDGWQNLAAPYLGAGNGPRYITGVGTRSGGQQMAFLMKLVGTGGGAWLNAAGGSWQSSADWSLGSTPTLGDDAVFNIDAAYTVTFSDHGAAHALNVSVGSVTLDLASHRLNVARETNVHDARLRIINGVVRTGSVSVERGQLELADTSMIVDYNGTSPISDVHALIVSGCNGGLWSGDGITSSAAANDSRKAMGIADNAVLGLTQFAGEYVDASSLLMTLTWVGDANLDRKVDVTDLGALATNWQTSGVWTSGDFDYSGTVDVSDLSMLAGNWQAGADNPSAQSLSDALAALGLPSGSIPEPLATWVGATVLVGLLRNRRRGRVNTRN